MIEFWIGSPSSKRVIPTDSIMKRLITSFFFNIMCSFSTSLSYVMRQHENMIKAGHLPQEEKRDLNVV